VLVTRRGHTKRRILERFMRYGLPTQSASLARGRSRRITIDCYATISGVSVGAFVRGCENPRISE
jgi:hypothetical protein